ncbi:low affinity iron permease family protein [Pseudomonas tructae]|uniref:Low affinity iron permease family protein n=1 Tax=Pseudomonas tructae TaxID=2518644 RepID=A0A411MIY9_9PSED|nr:low affinity iron permease family protein [Pseudomonas tructae]QBF26758.1 low affinity iron permease family protein [Pseudomonas tructae]
MKFSKFCQALSNRAGSSKTFLVALGLIVAWAITGPYFHYNDTWQLIINTSTTIITFLMVFLIQNTQNRDNDILHLKLDELIRATKDAKNVALCLEDLDTKDLHVLRKKYRILGEAQYQEPTVAEEGGDALITKKLIIDDPIPSMPAPCPNEETKKP